VKQINTFYYIENQEQLEELIKILDQRFGVASPKYKDSPSNFPVLLTYGFVQDINGASIAFKHINIEQIESLVASLDPTS